MCTTSPVANRYVDRSSFRECSTMFPNKACRLSAPWTSFSESSSCWTTGVNFFPKAARLVFEAWIPQQGMVKQNSDHSWTRDSRMLVRSTLNLEHLKASKLHNKIKIGRQPPLAIQDAAEQPPHGAQRNRGPLVH